MRKVAHICGKTQKEGGVMHTATISEKITHGEKLIVLTMKEYEEKVLRTRQIENLLKVIAEGEKEYYSGKIKPIHSLAELK